jgi:succinate-semialdehyde dehydrogenase/glutarate-semialdehyde dehydrogenase
VPIASINPATNELIRSFDAMSRAEVDRRLTRAVEAFKSNRLRPISQRAKLMRKAAEILERRKRELGEMMTLEMGKPIGAAVAEAEKCALACRYYAEHAATFLRDQEVKVEDGSAWVAFQPLGVVLAVMPWNFPFWQVIRFAAPALMAGNVGVLKHASNVPQCALALERLFVDAGFEEGVFQALLIPAADVDAIISDGRIAAVTLTGSDGAGRAVATAAGKHLKKCVVELGGSDPFIVLPSANLRDAISTAVTARMINNGQSCIAAKRFIVHRDVYEQFLSGFVETVRALRVGDPMDPQTQLGPLATSQVAQDLDDQVKRTIAAGARVLAGGKRIAGPGNFFEPTVLVDVPTESPASSEELFGPVASVFRADNIDHAIELANSTRFGLGASAWTNDSAERDQLVRDVQAGSLFINGMVASDPRLPFGGVKDSGFGRELGEFGIHEFMNIKTIRIVEREKKAASE